MHNEPLAFVIGSCCTSVQLLDEDLFAFTTATGFVSSIKHRSHKGGADIEVLSHSISDARSEVLCTVFE